MVTDWWVARGCANNIFARSPGQPGAAFTHITKTLRACPICPVGLQETGLYIKGYVSRVCSALQY